MSKPVNPITDPHRATHVLNVLTEVQTIVINPRHRQRLALGGYDTPSKVLRRVAMDAIHPSLIPEGWTPAEPTIEENEFISCDALALRTGPNHYSVVKYAPNGEVLGGDVHTGQCPGCSIATLGEEEREVAYADLPPANFKLEAAKNFDPSILPPDLQALIKEAEKHGAKVSYVTVRAKPVTGGEEDPN